jgi:hypothetical protein
MGVAVNVLTEPGVARPVALVLDGPALTHQPEQRFRANAQGGDEQVHLEKQRAVAPVLTSSMIQLAQAQPSRMAPVALRARRVQRTWRPSLTSKSLINHRQVPVSTELEDYLLIQ